MDALQYPNLKLTDLSTLAHTYRGFFRVGETAMGALIVGFSGTYRSGSSGNTDAHYMAAIAAAGIEAWSPHGLVFDLRDLAYDWGDRIERALSVGRGKRSTLEEILMGKESELKETDIPVAIVVSNRCRAGLEGLIREEMAQDPVRWLFDSVETALVAIQESQM